MNRQERRQRGDRTRQTPRAAKPEAGNATLRELRFESAQASQAFMDLRYLDDAYKGSTDNAVRLPPNGESVSTTPGSGGMVYKAFPHGLMYGDQLSLMGGIGVFLGLSSSWFGYLLNDSGWVLFDFSRMNPLMVVLFIGLFAVITPMALLLFLSDLMGYRFSKSALFDRQAGKVHLFTDKSAPWRGNKGVITTYDWSCIRAEVDSMSVFTGIVGRSEVGLRCVVLDKPGGSTVVNQFPLGVNMPANHVQPLLDTWEHVRRFMQREGPLFADESDGTNPGLGRQSLWKCLMLFPALEISTTLDMFKIGWEEKSLLTLFMAALGIVLIPALPLMALFGLFPWISSLFKRDPKWPAEIIASVGGNALKGQELEAWRNVVPGPKAAIEARQPPALQ